MGAAVVFSAIGIAGCIGFLTLGRLRSSRYAAALGIVFGALAVLMLAVYAGGYVECERRGACPAGLAFVKVVYFGLLATIAVMLLGGLGLLAKVPISNGTRVASDFPLALWIVLAVAVLGFVYLALALVFALFLVVAVEQRQWEAFLVFLAMGALPIGALTWQTLRAEKTALRAARARVLGADEKPELHELVARLAATADVPPPRIAVAPSGEANSFFVGLTRERGTIVVTSELLRRLDRGQLEAVLAHEVGHMANRDGVLMTFVSAPAMLGSLLLRADRAFPLFLLYSPVWVLGLLLLWTTARAREYYADRAAALMTGAPEQLMSALQELGGMKAKGDLRGGAAMYALCIVRPGRRRWYKPDLSHPPIEKRLERLQELARRLGALSPSGDVRAAC